MDPVVPTQALPPSDLAAHQNLVNNPAYKAQQVVDAQPHFARDPQMVMALAGMPGVDGHTAANATQLIHHVSDVSRTVQQHAEANPKHSSGPSWWDQAVNFVQSGIDKISQNPIGKALAVPDVQLRAVGSALEGTIKSLPTLAKDLNELSDPSKWMSDVVSYGPAQALKNYTGAVSRQNPLAMFNNARSTLAMYEMLKQTRGTAYADSWIGTNIALAILTKKALGVGSAGEVGGEVSAEAAAAEKAAIKADPKLIKDFEKRTANGETLTQAEKDAASEAQQRIAQRETLANQEKQMKADRQELLKQQTKLRRGAAAVFKAVTLPIKPAFAALKFATKPGQDFTANAVYEYAHMSSQSDPEMSKMWDQAQTGIVTDKYGRKVTAGQDLMELFGATPGDMAFQVGGGSIDFYNKWLGSDPFGAVGKVIGQSRTAEGFGSGMLSKWFNGLGMTSGDRVYQALQQYSRVRRAFEYMATHDRTDILRTFRGVFDYGSPAGKALLNDIGKANSVEEVARIFADAAEGMGMVRHVVPTMTPYELLKAKLPATRFFSGDVSKLLSMDEYAIEEYQKATTGKTGWDFMPKNAAEAGASDVGLRSRATFGRWLVKQFTRNAAFIDETTKKWSNYVIRPGSTAGLEALGDHLLASGIPRRVMKAAIDSMIDAPPEDYVNLFRSVYFYAVARRFMTGASNPAADSVLVSSLAHIRDEVMRMTGSDGGSILGNYIGGEEGANLSQIVESGDSPFAGSTYFAGIGSTHLGELTLPNVSSLRGLAVQTTQLLHNLTPTDMNKMAMLLHASADTIASLTTFYKATLANMSGDIAGLSGTRPDTTFSGDYVKTSANAYEQTIASFATTVGKTTPKNMVQNNKDFVASFDFMRKQLFRLTELSAKHGEYRMAEGIVGNWNTPIGRRVLKEINANLPEGNITDIRQMTPQTIARLEGQKAALRDISAKFTDRLQSPAFTFDEIRAHINNYNEVMAGAKFADKELVTQMAKNFNKMRDKNSRFLNPYQHIVAGLNEFLSKTFVPMALGSGGWSLRVSLSETILNTLRQGWGNSFEGRILTSIAKHESVDAAHYGKFIEKMSGKEGPSKYVAGEWNTRKDETSLLFKTIAHALIGVRELAAGAVLGVERNLVNLNDIGSQRMLDNFASAIVRHKGHLPMGVHDQGGDIYDNGLASASAVYGVDENGNAVKSMVYRDRTFGHVNAGVGTGGKGYVTALFEGLNRIHSDPVLSPTMQELARILDQKAVEELGLQAVSVMTSEQRLKIGAEYFTTQAEIDQLTKQLEAKAYDTIQRMNPELRSRFARDHSTNKKGFSYSGTGTFPESEVPHRDWAKSIAYHDLHMVMGRPVGEDYMIHASLLDQAATGNIKDAIELSKDIKAIPRGAEPKNIPARQFIDRNWRNEGSRLDLIQRASEKLHSSVLGPIVNTLARDPLFLMEYHNAYEALRPMLENNIYTIEQAEVMADTAAIQNMSKYVHNPKDKTVFEANMRVLAPFYFAQNQAWRRALRVLRNDPGAFEKYLKLCLHVTNHVSVSSVNGSPSVHIPGTEFMGWFGGSLNNGLLGLENLAFSLSADPGSVSSIVVTGHESGLGMLGNIVRPAWGSVVTVPLKLASHFLGFDHIPVAKKIIDSFLGSISSRTSITSDLVPSAPVRNAYTVAQSILGNDQSAMSSIMINVMHNAADNLMAKYYNDFYAKIKDSTAITNDEKVTLARSYAETEIVKFKINPENMDNFIKEAHSAALGMFIVKSVLSFGSPFALSLTENFSKNAEFQKIVQEKDSQGNIKYTRDQALSIFINKYPTAIFDMVSSSKSPYIPYAETTSAVDLLTNHPEVAKNYPYAAAYLIDRNAKHDPNAYSLEQSAGLRQRQAPKDYYNALQVAGGQDFYYNWLKPQYTVPVTDEQGITTQQFPQGEQGYRNYTELKNAATNYGNHFNPIWGEAHSGNSIKYNNEIKAFGQMETMVADPTVSDSLFGGKDQRNIFETLIKAYQNVVTEYDNASSAKEQAQIQTSWYDKMTNLSEIKSDGELVFARQEYFITNVLRNLPTKIK